MTTTTTTAAASSSAAATSEQRLVVDFWFDPACPWAWITSRWIREVEKVRPVEVRWHVMSLVDLNAEKEITDEWRVIIARLRGPVRVIVAAQRDHGDTVVGPLYTALGTRFHLGKAPKERATYVDALREVGLPEALADAAEDISLDPLVSASHERGISLVGDDVGTPIVLVDGQAIFGPIVTPIPRGEDAGRLWDGVRTVLSVDGFFELKRTRDREPTFD